jgi:putative transposase
VPGAFYHVTLRGNHRQNIFHCDEHRRWLDDIVAEALQRFGTRVHAYCWMTNHIHMMMQAGEMPLGRVMLRIASLYARRVQKHLVTTGHLFERRHSAILVDADEYLIKLLLYIHLNPVRARLVESPADYRWSSHAAYAGGEAPSWLTTDFAKRMLHADPLRAEDIYRRMMADELNRPTPQPFDQLNPEDPRVLGDDAFVAAMQGLAWRPRKRESIEAAIEKICLEDGISITDLYSASRRRLLSRTRAKIAIYCQEGRIASVSAVARKLGRDESSLREAMRKYFIHK